MSAKLSSPETAIKAMSDLAEETRKERGCLTFNFYQDNIHPNKFILMESFENENSMKIHLEENHTALFFNKNLVNIDLITKISDLTQP